MSDRLGRTSTCSRDQESAALERENRLLKQENERLRQQTKDLAQMRTDAAELMVSQERLLGEIEELARVEQTLRESEQRLTTVLNSILTGVLILDAHSHRIMDVNPHAVEIIGLPKEQILGKVCHQFICPIPEGRCPVSDLSRRMDRSESVLLKADGTRVPILKTVVTMTWQQREYLIESFVDISGLKRAQDSARESLSLLEATLESTADGLLVVDRREMIKSCNRQFKDLWGIPESVLATRSDREAAAFVLNRLKHPDAFLAKIRELYVEPEKESFDTLELIDGRIIERYSKPQVIGEQIVGRVWSFRDVTEKHLAARKQAALLQRVAEINEELTHFAYVVSHDLKAPLRGIRLIAEWLCADYGDKLGDEAKEQLDLLQSRVARMHNLIDGVLQYSRVGRITEEKADVDLNELISGVVDGIAAPEHIRIVVADDLPTIEGERTRITQVFQNLLTNAVKFMDKSAGQVRIDCVEDGDFWRFRVADNGPGIEEKYFDRIFRLFQTLVPRDEFESTGVGLALVKKIVEMYGGRIWVESEVGQGATFLFTFPRKTEPAASEPVELPGAGTVC
jgi:two-component system, LuxR family, sensor kinase FixL